MAALLLCLASIFLWVWTSGIYYRRLPTPALAVYFLNLRAGAGALQSGFHLQLINDEPAGSFLPRFSLELPTRGYNSGYSTAFRVHCLGFTAALLPRVYYGGDVVVSPFAALVLPWWLLTLTFAWLTLRHLGLWTGALRHCRSYRRR
jgi:hypothetical protein